MKRFALLTLLVLILCGCKSTDGTVDRAMTVRERLLSGNGCTFDATITADYADAVYVFQMQCSIGKNGEMEFRVLSPDVISDITGCITDANGMLTFDEKAVAFPLIADGRISPVSAPWLMIKALRSGYISACSEQDGNMLLVLDDSYSEDAMQVDIVLDKRDLLISCEILWRGTRYLSIHIENFVYL